MIGRKMMSLCALALVLLGTHEARAQWMRESLIRNSIKDWSWENPGFWCHERGRISALGGDGSGFVETRSQWPVEASLNMSGSGMEADRWIHRDNGLLGVIEAGINAQASASVDIREGPSAAGAFVWSRGMIETDGLPWIEAKAAMALTRATTREEWGQLGVRVTLGSVEVGATLPLTSIIGTGHSTGFTSAHATPAERCPVTEVTLHRDCTVDLRAWADSGLLQLRTSTAATDAAVSSQIVYSLLETSACGTITPAK